MQTRHLLHLLASAGIFHGLLPTNLYSQLNLSRTLYAPNTSVGSTPSSKSKPIFRTTPPCRIMVNSSIICLSVGLLVAALAGALTPRTQRAVRICP